MMNEVTFHCQSDTCRGAPRTYHLQVTGGGSLKGRCGACEREEEWTRVKK